MHFILVCTCNYLVSEVSVRPSLPLLLLLFQLLRLLSFCRFLPLFRFSLLCLASSSRRSHSFDFFWGKKKGSPLKCYKRMCLIYSKSSRMKKRMHQVPSASHEKTCLEQKIKLCCFDFFLAMYVRRGTLNRHWLDQELSIQFLVVYDVHHLCPSLPLSLALPKPFLSVLKHFNSTLALESLLGDTFVVAGGLIR